MISNINLIREIKPKAQMKQASIYIPTELDEWISRFSDSLGVSRNQVATQVFGSLQREWDAMAESAKKKFLAEFGK